MQNLYLIRTATVVTLTAALLGVGWISMPGDEAQIAPQMVSLSALAEPTAYFPAAYVLQPNEAEPEAYEYH
jgi:hypothetical protein